MKNTKSKAEEYVKQSGAEFILAAQKSDEENVNFSPELRAVKRLAAILGAWVNEPRTDEAWQFYQDYDSPCTNRMLHCDSDIQKTCDKLSYAGRGDFAREIKEHWQKVVDYANTADDNISTLRLQYQRGDINKKDFAKKVKLEANKPRNKAASLCGRLKRIAKTQEKGGQSIGGKVDSTNEKSSETWCWKLYEKTIKAFIAAILDRINPS